ncbi:MAG: 50S ribosomal protein L24 [Actinomycetota bacterium]|nr:50S ribosomal protein L24 [Actinomycetota bacterium]
MKIKKGDRVVVLSGKDRGKEGVVMRALPADGKVIVEGVNTARKHQRPTRMTQSGGIVDKDMPIDASNVAILSPKDGRATRVGYRIKDDGTKVRICKRTGAEL